MAEGVGEYIHPLVRSVYQEVWNEFYEWEQEYARDAIRSLQCEATLELLDESNEQHRNGICSPHSITKSWVISPDSINWDYPDETVTFYEEATDMIEYKIPHLRAPKMDPFPSYECPAPSSSNIFVGDDSDSMPFVPFPDEKSFQFEVYYNHYGYFAWQKKRMDPDGM